MNELIVNQSEGFNVSGKYQVVKTSQVLDMLKNEGFEVTQFSSAKTRKKTKEGFQKHLLRLSHPYMSLNIEGLRPEVILINSYDGSTSFRLLIGIYRMVCANGLMLGNSFFDRRIKHVGDVKTKILTSTNDVIKALPLVAKQVENMSNKKIGYLEQFNFASQVFNNIVPDKAVNLHPEQLLNIRRTEDEKDDLFTVLNRIQENALNGSVSYEYVKTTEDNIAEIKTRKLKRVNSIDRTTEINQLIWNIAEKMVA